MFMAALETYCGTYFVAGSENWDEADLLAFVYAVADPDGGIDFERLLPRLDLPPWGLSDEELAAVRRGTLAFHFDAADPLMHRLRKAAESEYRMELILADGAVVTAVGSFGELARLLEVYRDETAPPALYRDEFGDLRILLHEDVLGIGAVRRVEEERRSA